MNYEEQSYLELAEHILENGVEQNDRTSVGTLSTFGAQLRFNLQNGFPLLTTKKMFWRGIVEELLWFLRGETDSKILEAKGVNIWKGNTSKEFLEKRGLDYPEGEIGPLYGFQWKYWGADFQKSLSLKNKMMSVGGIDQITNVIESIKHDPTSRRHVVSAWNVADLDKGVLPPCHVLFQFWVNPKLGTLSCQLYQRSCDFFLGAPFNIASYALLLELIARVTGYKAGEFIWVGGDVHIYKNHIEQVKLQNIREPFSWPRLEIVSKIESLEDIEALTFDDIKLLNYKSHPAIKGEMAI
jgi:thymidylate synthase